MSELRSSRNDRRGPISESGGRVVERFENPTQRGIVQAAIPLFRDYGYRGTSIGKVCTKAGVSKPTFYYYFPSKLSLLSSMLELSLEMIEAALASADNGQGTPPERLRRLIRAYTHEVCDRPALWTIYFAERDLLPDEIAESMIERERRIVARFEAILGEGMKLGVFPRTEVVPLAMAFIGMASWLHRWFRKGGDLKPDDLADVFGMLADRLSEPS